MAPQTAWCTCARVCHTANLQRSTYFWHWEIQWWTTEVNRLTICISHEGWKPTCTNCADRQQGTHPYLVAGGRYMNWVLHLGFDSAHTKQENRYLSHLIFLAERNKTVNIKPYLYPCKDSTCIFFQLQQHLITGLRTYKEQNLLEAKIIFKSSLPLLSSPFPQHAHNLPLILKR